ncbi:hypothetical protein [Streptococcus uberis]|uniref:hypothetical protein n=1 Tax=Streptococcus uberis TaxID=1349 RepID=UPI0038924559
MGLFQKLFRRDVDDSKDHLIKEEEIKEESSWEQLPAYIDADQADFQLVSLIASSIAAGDYPESQFVVKRILQRNPEVVNLSLIATSIASGDAPDSQFNVKAIYQKKIKP